VGSLISQKKNIDSQLPVVNPLDTQAAAKGAARSSQDAFNFSGYNKERITVEFQKMDLHNVFNFLRQISGVNIVVDEAVKGSLTLVLDDVPWDFALDIILNLKDLEKEERFNTLVIYPKGKGFNWPQQATNNLSFEADEDLVEKETLVIQQQESLPVGVMEAKQQMGVAREAEKREDFETAVRVYEQALEKWPDNAKLANKIASIYLVQLRQNAKALHFAKKALQAAPDNDSAALNAAIASANMQDRKSARHYFEQSVNAQKPSREALLSFAVFNEEQRDFAAAITVLEQHDRLYGKDLNGMVATARIYDKMGQPAKATQAYQAIQRSGYSIPPDLEKYIKGRIAMKQTL
jgi:type IV pilus assembly protein PilQ